MKSMYSNPARRYTTKFCLFWPKNPAPSRKRKMVISVNTMTDTTALPPKNTLTQSSKVSPKKRNLLLFVRKCAEAAAGAGSMVKLKRPTKPVCHSARGQDSRLTLEGVKGLKPPGRLFAALRMTAG